MEETGTCAMYVDGDGVPYWLIEKAVRDARRRFRAVAVRAYKDWTAPGNRRLMASLADLDVFATQVTPHAGLGNATDIAITVDVVDALHTNPSDAVALVGNDGDFTSLAHHVRGRGTAMLGYGSREASAALRSACDQFVRFDPVTQQQIATDATARNLDDCILDIICATRDEDGWARLDRFGFAVRAAYGLSAKDTGSRSWMTYLTQNPRFECLQEPDGFTWVRVASRSNDAASVLVRSFS